jgi:hypothetical protein
MAWRQYAYHSIPLEASVSSIGFYVGTAHVLCRRVKIIFLAMGYLYSSPTVPRLLAEQVSLDLGPNATDRVIGDMTSDFSLRTRTHQGFKSRITKAPQFWNASYYSTLQLCNALKGTS